MKRKKLQIVNECTHLMCKTYACRIFEQPLELESKGFQQANWKLESFWWRWKAWKGKECTKSTIKRHTKLKKSLICSVLTSSHPNTKQMKIQTIHLFQLQCHLQFP